MRAPHLYLESVGVTEPEKDLAIRLAAAGPQPVDPVVSVFVGATSGHGYRHLVGVLRDYPIPAFRMPPGQGELLLDVGCSWGRWSIAASRAGYRVVGIDPSLGAAKSARRVAASLSLIRMAHRLGARGLHHQTRKAFRAARAFEVRYWSVFRQLATFEGAIGPTSWSVDCLFGLGLQASGRRFLPWLTRLVAAVLEFLRRLSERIPVLRNEADGVFVLSRKSA
jgi:hypothetical protein